MRQPRIAVLGADGLIGSAVATRLAVEAVVLRAGRRPDHDIAVDLAAPSDALALALRHVDAVVHCAGVTDEEFAADRAGAWRRGSEATARLAELIKVAGIRRVVYVSTAHVYGPLRGPINERMPPDPRSDYAIAHFAAEQIFRRMRFAGGALRPCAVFGLPPDLAMFKRWSLVPFAFPKMAVESGIISLASPGFQRRNFVAAVTVADHVAALLRQADSWSVVNPIGGDDMSVRDYAELVARAAGRIIGRDCRVDAPRGELREAPLAYLSESGSAAAEGLLEAATATLIQHLLDRNDHAASRHRASA